MKLTKTGIQPLDSYCESVVKGKIEVCRWVRLAVERHYRDLKRWGVNEFNPEKGKFEKPIKKGQEYYFSCGALNHYVNFFADNLRHYDGIFAGKPFTFEPWQYFAFGSPFAWLSVDRINGMPVRRFSELDVFVPKKQGKSVWIAGTMLYMIESDGYPGAQVYALALNQSHAKTLGYRDAEILVKNSPTLSEKYKVNKGAATIGIYYPPNDSHVKPLVSNEQIADGPKIHFAANDEVKDWENFNLYNTLINGTASDPTAMVANITTAGDNKISVGFERQNHIQQVLEQKITDDHTFGVIYTIDTDKEKGEEKSKDELEWDTERVWKKANPNYNVSVGKKYYEKRVNSSKNSQANKNDFLIKHLNVWVDSLSGWLNMDAWDMCADKSLKIEDVADYDCVVSVDLASKIDLTVVERTFFKGDECWNFANFYLPEGALLDDKKYNEAMKSQIRRWAEAGYITLTPGVTVDQDIIKADVKDAFRDHNVISLPYDPWNATQFANDLQKDGIDVEVMLEYGQQGYAQWTEAMKETERLVLEGKLHHAGNPVMRWNMGNVVIRIDNNDNIRPLKELPQNKIDGAVALFMAVAMGMIRPTEEEATDGNLFAV